MTRTTNARIAGFTFLFYSAIGICGDLLMKRAFGVEGDAATLARFGEYAADVRIDVLIKVLEVLSALVLAVTLYGITRDEDHELAMLALVCRVGEGVFVALSIPSYLGLVWLAKARVGPGALDNSSTNALRTFMLMPVPSVPLSTIFFAVGSTIFSYLFLRGRIVPVAIAWMGVFASGLPPWRCLCNSPVFPQGRCTDTTSGCQPSCPKPRSRCGCLSKVSPYRRRDEPPPQDI
jgi:hypothetical protein